MIFGNNQIKISTIVAVMVLYGNFSCEKRERAFHRENLYQTKNANDKPSGSDRSEDNGADAQNKQDRESKTPEPTDQYQLRIDKNDKQSLQRICCVIFDYLLDMIKEDNKVSFGAFLKKRQLCLHVKEDTNAQDANADRKVYTITDLARDSSQSNCNADDGNLICLIQNSQTYQPIAVQKLLHAIANASATDKAECDSTAPHLEIFYQLYLELRQYIIYMSKKSSSTPQEYVIDKKSNIRCESIRPTYLRPLFNITRDLMVRLFKYAEKEMARFKDQNSNLTDLQLDFSQYKEDIPSLGNARLLNNNSESIAVSEPGIPLIYIAKSTQDKQTITGYIRHGAWTDHSDQGTGSPNSKNFIIYFSYPDSDNIQQAVLYSDSYQTADIMGNAKNLNQAIKGYFKMRTSPRNGQQAIGVDLEEVHDLNQGDHLRDFLGTFSENFCQYLKKGPHRS